MNIATKRKAGERLGRAGISADIIRIAQDISKGSYKEAIILGGQISVLIEACGFDEYWKEKAWMGKNRQEEAFESLLDCTGSDNG